MSVSSLELIDRLEKRGSLSKQAADSLRAKRELVLANTIAELAHGTHEKRAGFFDLLSKAKTPAMTGGAAAAGAAGTPIVAAGPQTWSDALSNVAKILAIAGLASGGAAAARGIGNHMRGRALEQDIEGAWPEVQTRVKRLNEASADGQGTGADEESVRDAFMQLVRLAPNIAAIPSVAAPIVRDTVMYPTGVKHDDRVRRWMDLQRGMDEMRERNSAFDPNDVNLGVNVATKALGGK